MGQQPFLLAALRDGGHRHRARERARAHRREHPRVRARAHSEHRVRKDGRHDLAVQREGADDGEDRRVYRESFVAAYIVYAFEDLADDVALFCRWQGARLLRAQPRQAVEHGEEADGVEQEADARAELHHHNTPAPNSIITAPARAGPMMRARLTIEELSETAFITSSFPTRHTKNESRAGTSIVVVIPRNTASEAASIPPSRRRRAPLERRPGASAATA